MLKWCVLLLTVLSMGACASRGSMPSDMRSPSETKALVEISPSDPLPMHIFRSIRIGASGRTKGMKEKGVPKKLRVIDVPFSTQAPDQLFQMFIFPNKRFQVPPPPVSTPLSASDLSLR